jgi:hypothetical protein
VIIDLLSLRGLMLLEGFVSLMLYAHVIGTKFFSHQLRVLRAGEGVPEAGALRRLLDHRPGRSHPAADRSLGLRRYSIG